MFWWVLEALGVIVCTVILVRLLSFKIIPWFIKKYYPENYENFRKKYLDGEEK